MSYQIVLLMKKNLSSHCNKSIWTKNLMNNSLKRMFKCRLWISIQCLTSKTNNSLQRVNYQIILLSKKNLPSYSYTSIWLKNLMNNSHKRIFKCKLRISMQCLTSKTNNSLLRVSYQIVLLMKKNLPSYCNKSIWTKNIMKNSHKRMFRCTLRISMHKRTVKNYRIRSLA